MSERIGLSGFFLDNIRDAIKKECWESGNPEDFFDCLEMMVEELDLDRSWLKTLEDWMIEKYGNS